MKFLSYELAKQLQDAGFLLDISKHAAYEKLFLYDRRIDRVVMVGLNDAVEKLASIEFTFLWLPSFEDIMQDELMRGFIYESLPESLVYQPSKPYKDQISFSGASAVEAAARAWLFLHDKKPKQV
jgi:hypothetical protein